MTGIESARGESRRTRPAPEILAVVFAVVLYGVLLAISMPSTANERPTPLPSASAATGSASPRASSDPLRQDILGLLEIDKRLTANRATLRTLLKEREVDSSKVKVVLREITQTVGFGSERAARLAVDGSTHDVGGRLEVIYATADATVEEALDAALSNVEPYEVAARSIVELFAVLPAIDRELEALLKGSAASPSVAPSASASVAASPSATTAPSASAAPASPSASPGASGSVVDRPGEMLRDRSFEKGVEAWEVVADPGSLRIAADKPLVGSGSASLRLDLSVPADPAAITRLGQVVSLVAGERYVATLTMRSSFPRPVLIRVVGPNLEPYAVESVDIGPEAGQISVPFTAQIDDPAAHLWIEFPGAGSGSVWLDDASMTRGAGP